MFGFDLPLWAVPMAAAGRAVLAWLRALTMTVNGVVIVSIVAGMIGGGWWIGRHARADERARIEKARAEATRKISHDVAVMIRLRRGEIAATDQRVAAVSAEIKRLVAEIPAEVQTVVKTELQRETIYVPATAPAPELPRTTGSKPYGDQYPPAVLDALNRINVSPTGSLK